MPSTNKRERELLKPGEKVLDGRYEILKVIHSKGMSAVYLVLDSKLNKQWCLKEIKKSDAGKDDIEYYALLQEANIMKSLNHSSIPRITTIEEEGDSLFIIMDYVDGISIKSWLTRKGKIQQDVAVSWMKQITQVMIYLHNRHKPILYRDMKPDNVMIQGDGNIKLLDFGISIVIKEKGQLLGNALGTNGYAAPEQKKKTNVCDLRSDIYAMGRTLYYMLTGINPNLIPKGKELKPIREIDSSISVGLEQIVNKCTMYNPDDRYQTCEELLYDLQNYQYKDTKYISKIKKKCTTVLGLFVTSIVILVSSFIPLTLYKNQQNEYYKNLLVIAEQSGKVEDYENVLGMDTTDIQPYIGYINALKVDGVFSKKEENSLLGYINPKLEILKQSKEYGSLAYEIGKLYWFYYEGSSLDEGMVVSVKWFSDSIDAGYEEELSEVYYQLGSFKRNISTSMIESSDVGMYKAYWINLMKAKDVDSGELVKLQLNLSIANCISTYAYNLKSDGISYKEINKEINELQKYVEYYSPNIEKAEESYNLLKTTLGGLSDKVDAIYGEGGNS